jgi:uncharacterized protein (DUF4415 family)
MAKMTKEQLAKLAEMPDEEIDFSDIPEVTDFSGFVRSKNKSLKEVVMKSINQQNIEVNWEEINSILDKIQNAKTKDRVSLRLDHDIVSYYRKQGRKYQTKINDILRAFMIAEKKAHTG